MVSPRPPLHSGDYPGMGVLQEEGTPGGDVSVNCVIGDSINDCHWNIDGHCTSLKVNNVAPNFVETRVWGSRLICPFTQIGVHLCSAYLPEGQC